MALVGIDLGTTNSLISYWTDEGVKLIPNEFDEYLTPSIVGFYEDNQVCVGKTAREMMITDPSRAFREFKRAMGSDKTYVVSDLSFTPEELSAFVLKQLKQDAEKYLGEEVTEAIISVPAYFSDKQRSATRIAGQLAGLKVERLINEPSAAALAYKIADEKEHETYLVFDFGGGTLDVSIVDSFDNIVEILAVSGDNQLGGKDFNEVIETCFYRDNQLDKDALTASWRELIYREAEECKILLSSNDSVDKIIPIDGKDYTLHMTNDILKKESLPIFQKVLKVVQKAMSMSDMDIGQMDQVILVGGSSKMPIVKMFLKSIFRAEILCELNPDEIVAIGTGVVVGIKGRKMQIKDMLLSDICPFSLGVGIYDGTFSTIINRNEILPCSKSEYYTTVSNDQLVISLLVYQGNQMLAKDNEEIAKIDVPVPPLPKGKAVVKVEFSYDINGIFEIHTTCMNDQSVLHKTLINQKSGMTKEEIQMKLEQLTTIKENAQSKTKMDYLIYRANRLYMMANTQQQQLIIKELKQYKDLEPESENSATKRERYVRFSMVLDMVESQINQIHADDFFES